MFNEATHAYTKDGKKYTSVSEIIEQFIPEFQKYAIAGRMKGDTQDILDEWELNSDISKLYGTAIHKALEYWIRFGKITKIPHIRKVIEAFSKKYAWETLKSEIVVDSDDLIISGTIDVLEVIGRNRVNIVDLKTNYELDKAGHGKLLNPFDYLDNNKINKYRLQLSTYKELVERKGITVENLLLEHWNGEELQTIKLEPLEILVHVANQ